MTRKTKSILSTSLILLLLIASILKVYSVTNTNNFSQTNDLSLKIKESDKKKENYVIVFYKEGCPLCKESRKEINQAFKESNQKIYFADVKSNAGKQLVKKYNIEFSPTVLLKDNQTDKVYSSYYAIRNSDKKIEVQSKTIHNFMIIGQPYE